MEVKEINHYDAIITIENADGSYKDIYCEFDVRFEGESPIVKIEFVDIPVSYSQQDTMATLIAERGNHNAWYADFLQELGDQMRDLAKAD